jgi:hypothetical protein
LSFAVGQPDAADLAHCRLLAGPDRARRHSQGESLASAEFSTILLRLFKIAARVRETATRVRLAFAAGCPDAEVFRGLVGALRPRAP